MLSSLLSVFSNRMNILKRLVGSTCGCARSTPNTTFKTFIQLLMTYCCEALITAPQSVINMLEAYSKIMPYA